MSHYSGQVPDTRRRKPDWRTSAACRAEGVNPDAMFPDNNTAGIAIAKSICRTCPVWRACLRDAIHTGDNQHGIRGGLRPDERRAVAKELARRASSQADTPDAPQPKKPRKPRATTLAEAVARRLHDTDDGHQLLNGSEHVQFQGKKYTALQAAFTVAHGREPEGLVRRTCGHSECVRGTHLTDAVIRDSAAVCGTRAGYLRHRKHGEDACRPCRQANTDADNRLRRTGTTKKAAA